MKIIKENNERKKNKRIVWIPLDFLNKQIEIGIIIIKLTHEFSLKFALI